MPSRAERPGPARPRLRRAAAALVLSSGLVLASAGCGMDAQTLKPYTPADGINADVGDPSNANTVVHVRNLMLISKEPGSAVVSASMVTNDRDQLTALSGNPIKIGGSAGTPFTAKLSNTVTLANGLQVVLTRDAPTTVTSTEIAPGLTASLTLQFKNAGSLTRTVPIVDGNEPQYASISPAPASESAAP